MMKMKVEKEKVRLQMNHEVKQKMNKKLMMQRLQVLKQLALRTRRRT